MYFLVLILSVSVGIWKVKKEVFIFFYLPPPFFSSSEKLEVEKVVSIDHLKTVISPALFLKETYQERKEGKLFSFNFFKFRIFKFSELQFCFFVPYTLSLPFCPVSVEEWRVL